MASYTPGSNQGTMNGTTAVEIVPPPAEHVARLVLKVHIYNKDTVNHTVTFYKDVNGTAFEIGRATVPPQKTLMYGSEAGEREYLTHITHTFRAVMGEAATTTQPTFTASYFDRDEGAPL